MVSITAGEYILTVRNSNLELSYSTNSNPLHLCYKPRNSHFHFHCISTCHIDNMIFESSQSPIKGTMLCSLLTNNKLIILEILDTQTIWSWLFDPEFSYLNVKLANGFQDADSGERISYKQVKSYATRTSTTFAGLYHIKPGHRIIIVCENSIWYPRRYVCRAQNR